VLIDALRGHEPFRQRVTQEITARSLATTVIPAFELLSGARTAREKEKVERILRPLLILPLDESASRLAAAMRLDLEVRGRGIGMADYLIAAICVSRSFPLLTRNRDHFERICRSDSGLSLPRGALTRRSSRRILGQK
jgi:predicted nucleic acid-binding protein